MLRCYEPAHIAGVSKTAYAPATPRCLQWRRDHVDRPARSGPQAPRRRLLVARRAWPPSSAVDVDRPLVHAARRPSTTRQHGRARRSPAEPSPTARRSSTTRFPGVAKLDPELLAPCAGPRPMPPATASGSSSTAAGAPRPTRSSCSSEAVSKYGSEAEAARWVATPEHVGARVGGRGRHRALRRRGVAVRRTAPRTGCARSTATSPGTTSCAPRPSITAALPCTPTPRTIRGCSSDE